MPCPTVRGYFALALSIASRRHRPLLQEFREDVLQECRLLAWEAESRRYITVNLIVTPEYLRKMRADHPDAIVYAVRLDRGASSAEVLKEKPGVRWAEERGLTDKQYISPGGGGFGEIMNNAFC